MDLANEMTPTQIILVWTLLSFLLIWLITFTLLALRPISRRHEGQEELHPDRSIPLPTTPSILRVIAPVASVQPLAGHPDSGYDTKEADHIPVANVGTRNHS